MKALEISHFRRIAGLDQCLVAHFDQLDSTAAQHSLLTEKIRLSLFLEIGFNNASLATTIGHGVA